MRTPVEQSFTFGSVSGSIFAFWFFGVVSLVVGVVAGALVSRLAEKYAWLAGRARPRWMAGLLGLVLAVVVFGSVYFGSLDGFYGLTVRGEEIQLHYILPERTLLLKRDGIAEGRAEPSYKGRWRLHLYSPAGLEFVSAHGSFAEVRAAGKFLAEYLKQKSTQNRLEAQR